MAITHVALSFIAPLSLFNPLQKAYFFLTSAVLVQLFSSFFLFQRTVWWRKVQQRLGEAVREVRGRAEGCDG